MLVTQVNIRPANETFSPKSSSHQLHLHWLLLTSPAQLCYKGSPVTQIPGISFIVDRFFII